MTNFNTNAQREAVLKAKKNGVVGPNSKLMRDYRNSLPELDSFQLSICIGLLLGDASLEKGRQNTHRLKFE